ncbi:MAG: DUF2147 domain-containing protein [Bacteroidales bacterium]|nr:DUF2147 domain-containing protein [Bacteroidales bacterium]
MKKIFLLAILTIIGLATNLSFAQSQTEADQILGKWLSQDKEGQFEIYKEQGKYYAKIYWLREPIDTLTGKPKLDKENPKADLQSRPLIGLQFLNDFEFKGDKLWEDGEIYDPKTGSTYDSYMKLVDSNTLKVRGYIGFSFIGRTAVWTRVKN